MWRGGGNAVIGGIDDTDRPREWPDLGHVTASTGNISSSSSSSFDKVEAARRRLLAQQQALPHGVGAGGVGGDFPWLQEDPSRYEHFRETLSAMFPEQATARTRSDAKMLHHWFRSEGKGLMRAAIFVLVKPIHCGKNCNSGALNSNGNTDCSHLKSMENLAASLEKRIFSGGGIGSRGGAGWVWGRGAA